MKLMQVEKSDVILNYLMENHIINLNILGKIENNSDLPIYTDDLVNPSGVLVKSGYMHYLYTQSDEFIDAVLDQHMKVGFYGFSGLDIRIAEKIKAKNILHWSNRCSIYSYNKPSVELVEGEYDLRPIAFEDAKTVDEFYEYRNDNSLIAIQNDIKYRPSSAVYVDGEPVCWVLVHEDNSMGIMYTKEAHRRKGLAEVVSRDLTKRILDKGHIPYLQIVDGNVKSHGLAQKCGYEKYGDCEWFGVITGHPKEIAESAHEVLKAFEAAYGRQRFESSKELEIEYFIMQRLEEVEEGYTVRTLSESDDFEKWSGLMKVCCGVARPSTTMSAWQIELNGDFVGAALMEEANDVESYMMHALEISADADMKGVIHSIMNKVKEDNRYFVCTVVEKDKCDEYERASFISNGPIR